MPKLIVVKSIAMPRLFSSYSLRFGFIGWVLAILDCNKILKWWRHKKWNFWNYGICQDILKEQCPRGLLTKNEHFGANGLWDVSRLYSENSIQTLLIFWGVDPKKFKESFPYNCDLLLHSYTLQIILKHFV